jgi:hypothetical protein
VIGVLSSMNFSASAVHIDVGLRGAQVHVVTC